MFYISIFAYNCFALVVSSLLVSLKDVEVIIANDILNDSKIVLHIIRDCMLRKFCLVKLEYFSNVNITKMLPGLSQVLIAHGGGVVSSQSWGGRYATKLDFVHVSRIVVYVSATID